MYDIENYYQAKSVKDAVRLLNEHPDARIISGGSDVLIKIREGKRRKRCWWWLMQKSPQKPICNC